MTYKENPKTKGSGIVCCIPLYLEPEIVVSPFPLHEVEK